MKKPKCTKCGSTNTAEILWGYPVGTPELDKALEERTIVLGGCCVGPDDPTWKCNECGNRWK